MEKNPNGIFLDGADMVRAASNFKTFQSTASQGTDMPEIKKIIIDTDPGQDDAVAILLALASP